VAVGDDSKRKFSLLVQYAMLRLHDETTEIMDGFVTKVMNVHGDTQKVSVLGLNQLFVLVI
jgi:iron-sulfur cluster repair protein YtfE (RIC family)